MIAEPPVFFASNSPIIPENMLPLRSGKSADDCTLSLEFIDREIKPIRGKGSSVMLAKQPFSKRSISTTNTRNPISFWSRRNLASTSIDNHFRLIDPVEVQRLFWINLLYSVFRITDHDSFSIEKAKIAKGAKVKCRQT
jgi:hypothetical protein